MIFRRGFGDASDFERDNFDYVVASAQGDTLEMNRITSATAAGAAAMAAAQAAADAAAAQAAADAASKRVAQGAGTSTDYVAAMRTAQAAADRAAALRASAAQAAAQVADIQAQQAAQQQAQLQAQQAAAMTTTAGTQLTTTVNPFVDITAAAQPQYPALSPERQFLSDLIQRYGAVPVYGGAAVAVLGLVLLLRRR